MKLAEAIKVVEERRKSKGKTVESYLLYEDAMALQAKTGESTLNSAVTKAVYHYLKCHSLDNDIRGHHRS